jgi:hypothetical protein
LCDVDIGKSLLFYQNVLGIDVSFMILNILKNDLLEYQAKATGESL